MNNELRATSILSLMQTTKAERKSFVAQVIDEMEAGNVNPLLIHCQVKSMQNLIDTFTEEKVGGDLKKKYSKLVLEEAQKYEKRFEMHNATFEVKEAGTKYDWSKCGDPWLADAMARHEALGAEIKTRQEFLKTISGSLEVVDQETGEAVTLYPPAKTSTTTVSVTLK